MSAITKITPTGSKVVPEEIQTYSNEDEVINVYNFESEQFAEIITLDEEDQRKEESIKEKAERKIEETVNRLLKEKAGGTVNYQIRSRLAFLEACYSVGMKKIEEAEEVISKTLSKLVKKRNAKLSKRS